MSVCVVPKSQMRFKEERRRRAKQDELRQVRTLKVPAAYDRLMLLLHLKNLSLTALDIYVRFML